ncbi:MAG TPA: hypothetical protein VIM11_27280 [Tepidisphaeraceae bacterium]
MIVYNLHVKCVSVLPAKTKTPLIIYPNAVLTEATAFEGLQPVARQSTQVIEP